MPKTNYMSHGVKLSPNQLKNIKRAIANNTSVSIKLDNDSLTGDMMLMLTPTQINKVQKAMNKGVGSTLILSTIQVSKQTGEGIKDNIKNFFKNDVKNFVVGTIPDAVEALATRGIPGLVGFAGKTAAKAITRKIKGGAIDPTLLLAGVTAGVQGVSSLADTIGKYSNEGAKRGFAKKIMSKRIARKAARNIRGMQRRAMKHYKRLSRMKNRGRLPDSVTDDDLWNMAVSTFASDPNDSAVIQQVLNDQYGNDQNIDEDGDYIPEEEEAEQVYGKGLFIHGKGLFLHGEGLFLQGGEGMFLHGEGMCSCGMKKCRCTMISKKKAFT